MDNFGCKVNHQEEGNKIIELKKIDHGLSMSGCYSKDYHNFLGQLDCWLNVFYKIAPSFEWKRFQSVLNHFCDILEKNMKKVDLLGKFDLLNKVLNKNLQFHIGCLGHFSYNNTQREFINRDGDTLSSSFKKAVKLQIQVARQFIDIIQKCNEINKKDVKTLIYDYCRCTRQRPNITLETWGKRKIYEIKRQTMPLPEIKIKNLSHAYCKIYNEKSV